MLNEKELLKLKGKVKTIDDLRIYLDENNLTYTDAELKTAYDCIASNEGEAELDLEDLSNVSGGVRTKGSGDDEMVAQRCLTCGRKLYVYKHNSESRPTICSFCGRSNTYKKRNIFGNFFNSFFNC